MQHSPELQKPPVLPAAGLHACPATSVLPTKHRSTISCGAGNTNTSIKYHGVLVQLSLFSIETDPLEKILSAVNHRAYSQ